MWTLDTLSLSQDKETLLNQQLYFLGRKTYSSHSILVNHSSVSRKHLSILVNNDTLIITHLNSANGLIIDGQQITHNQKVNVNNGKTVKMLLGLMEQPIVISYNHLPSRSRSRSRSREQEKKNNIQITTLEQKRKSLWANKQQGVNKYKLDQVDPDNLDKNKFMKLMGFSKNKVENKEYDNNYQKVNEQLEQQFENSRGRFDNRQGGLGFKG